MRLVIDSNILVSATLWGGLPACLLDSIEQKRVTLVISPQLLEEFGKVIARSKFAARLAARNVTPHKLVARIAREAELVALLASPIPAELRDPKDFIVLATASAGKVDAIVTGDEDLLFMKSFEGIPILQVRQALEKLGLSPK